MPEPLRLEAAGAAGGVFGVGWHHAALKGPVWLRALLLFFSPTKILTLLKSLFTPKMPPPPIPGDINVHKKWMRAALEMVLSPRRQISGALSAYPATLRVADG
jgi:hypothetical protein